jgi:hypothetical protein
MNKKPEIRLFLIILILYLLFPYTLQAQTKKVKVVVRNSSVRSEMHLQSKIFVSPSVGDVFEVIEKVAVWYKIKLDSEKYGSPEGYLHEMFVEELKTGIEETKAETEKNNLEKKKETEEIKTEPEEKEKKETKNLEMRVSDPEANRDETRKIVNEYINALQNKRLISFYELNCTSEFYPEAREEAEWIIRNYDRINSCASDISIQFGNTREADVSISLVITGLQGMNEARKLLFEGIYKWKMIKQDNNWKIRKSSSQSVK